VTCSHRTLPQSAKPFRTNPVGATAHVRPQRRSHFARALGQSDLFPGSSRTLARCLTHISLALPRMRIAHSDRGEPPVEAFEVRRTVVLLLAELMASPRGHEVQEFWWNDISYIRPGGLVVPIVQEYDGRLMVEPPGKALHVRRWRAAGDKWRTWIFIERGPGRRIKLERLSAWLGRGSRKRLLRNGRVETGSRNGCGTHGILGAGREVATGQRGPVLRPRPRLAVRASGSRTQVS
jgi:hypothetical protein